MFKEINVRELDRSPIQMNLNDHRKSKNPVISRIFRLCPPLLITI